MLRVISINRAEVLRRLRALKADSVSRHVLRSVTFEIQPLRGDYNRSERRYNTWLRISDDGKSTTLTLRHVPALKSPPKEHVVQVGDFIGTIRIVRMVLHGVDYSYLEIGRDSYSVAGSTVTIVQWPEMEPELEITGRSMEQLRKLYRDLKIKGEVIHRLDVPDHVYYKLRGLDFDMIRRQYNRKLDDLLSE